MACMDRNLWSPPRGSKFDACIDSTNHAGGTTYFVIKVELPNGSCWCVDKRFTEFDALRNTLQFDGIQVPDFQRTFNMEDMDAAIRERVTDLDSFIRTCLLRNDDNGHVRRFLQLDES